MNDDVFRNDILKYDVELPIREFFFTIDQIAYMLDMDQGTVEDTLLFYWGREYGTCPRDKIKATNLSMPDETPNWRVSQTAFAIWMRAKGVSFDDRRAPRKVVRGKVRRDSR